MPDRSRIKMELPGPPIRWNSIWGAVDEGDRGAFRHALRDALGVPVRETHAAVGCSLGYLVG